MKKRLNPKIVNMLSLLSIVVLLFGLMDDVLIKTNVIRNYLIVSESYILYVFSLIFTVATLGCTLLSIVVGVSSNRVLGLKLKEIIAFKEPPIKLNRMIVTSLFMVALSIPILAFDCNTAMTMLAMCLIAFIIYYTSILCKTVFNKEFVKRYIHYNLNCLDSIKPEYIQNWISALFNAINENDFTDEEEYLSLLNHAAEAQKQSREQIGKQISNLFSESFKHQSFIDSYRRILRLNDTSKVLFDERTITFNYIKNLKYADSKVIDSINLAGLIDSIVMCEFLDDEEKINNSFWFFSAVLDNKNLIESDRLEIVYNGFCSLLWLDDNYGFGSVRVEIAYSLFRNKVLLANDFEYGKKIYIQLLKALYKRNSYNESKSFASLLSKMVRMIYFWSFLEVETLSEVRRNLISSIPECRVNTTDNTALSINRLIDKIHNQMVEFLVEDAFNPNWSDPLDYFPELETGKALVCTPESKIKFALWFYSIWGYGFSPFPIKRTNMDSEDKILQYRGICIAAHQEFEINEELTKGAIENVKKLKRLFNKSYQLPSGYLHATFHTINSEIERTNNLLNNAQETITVPEISDKLKKAIEKKGYITLDESIDLENSTVFQLHPLLIRQNQNEYSFIVEVLQKEMINQVNNKINKRLDPVYLSFDQTGVAFLKNELAKRKYKFRNYTFYDDWALDTTTRNSSEFFELKKLVDSIPFKQNAYLRNFLFLNLDDVKMNYSIVEMRIEALEDDSLEENLDFYRVADEQYSIDGALYNKTAAIEYFKKTRQLLYSKLKIETNVKKESGFKVLFKRIPTSEVLE